MLRLSTLASGTCSRKQLPDFQTGKLWWSRHQGVRLTFSELAATVERTARGLAGLGLGAQDRIGVWSTNCVEWVQMHLACARIGAVLVNVNPAYRPYDLAFVLRKSKMKALFLWEKDKRSDYRAIVEEAMAGQTLALEHLVYFGTEGWAQDAGGRARHSGAAGYRPMTLPTSNTHRERPDRRRACCLRIEMF